ncbi:hypothetical protein [Streptosporangium sp. NPDC020145]|uniref:hypothetical protein n=1 Tax=Streptosporangium sp. NPDC020145 TaxID=3154694 RepID=UPI003416C4CD
MSDLLSTLFAVYVFIAALGGGSFLVKVAATPQVAKHYFESTTQGTGVQPWTKFFIELMMISLLWPLGLPIMATRKWWVPKLEEQIRKERLRKERAQSEQVQTDPPGSGIEPPLAEPSHVAPEERDRV